MTSQRCSLAEGVVGVQRHACACVGRPSNPENCLSPQILTILDVAKLTPLLSSQSQHVAVAAAMPDEDDADDDAAMSLRCQYNSDRCAGTLTVNVDVDVTIALIINHKS